MRGYNATFGIMRPRVQAFRHFSCFASLDSRRVVRLTGNDTWHFLQNVVTNDVTQGMQSNVLSLSFSSLLLF